MNCNKYLDREEHLALTLAKYPFHMEVCKGVQDAIALLSRAFDPIEFHELPA
jgi:hypothetical protein